MPPPTLNSEEPGNPRASLLLMRRNTRSVGITPLLIGCSATERVQRDGTGVAPHNKCSAYCVQRSLHPCARAGATCVNGAAGLRRRKTNRGGAQALRLGPLLMPYQRGDISA